MSRQMLVVTGTVLLLVGASSATAQEGHRSNGPAPAATKQIYTCPMHPEIQWTRPDKCPICEMKLVAKVAKAPSATDEMHDHAGMSMPNDGMQHNHSGMSSMMMGCGCSMCMEMMGMGGMNGSMNGSAAKAVAPATRSGRPMYRSYSPRTGTGRCGC